MHSSLSLGMENAISLDNPLEDLFTQSKSGSQLIHALDQLQDLTSNVDTWVKNRASFDFQNTSFTSIASQTIAYPLLSSLHIVNCYGVKCTMYG